LFIELLVSPALGFLCLFPCLSLRLVPPSSGLFPYLLVSPALGFLRLFPYLSLRLVLAPLVGLGYAVLETGCSLGVSTLGLFPSILKIV
jgi:hypothetical protein